MTCAELLRSDAEAAINEGGMYYSGEYLSGIAAAVEGLEAENAKLRELVRDMVLNMGGCALHGNPLRLREFMARSRELGIEVGV